jgi:hypothetical protein
VIPARFGLILELKNTPIVCFETRAIPEWSKFFERQVALSLRFYLDLLFLSKEFIIIFVEDTWLVCLRHQLTQLLIADYFHIGALETVGNL